MIYVLDDICCSTLIRNDGIFMSLRLMNQVIKYLKRKEEEKKKRKEKKRKERKGRRNLF